MNRQFFYAQSDADALKDYEYACSTRLAGTWDWIVLTAANERQAAAYRLQLDKRRREHRLPLGTQFEVVADFEDKRVGSGGATLNILRVLRDKLPLERLLKQKILVIHSGGDSKRIPQYSACGKLFGPVPRLLPGGYVSTLFDELLICAQGIPTRTGSGMMIFPSDTKLLFNALQLDLLSCQAAGLSMKAPVQVGQDHGVFVQADASEDHRNNNVSRFLHKRSEAFLRNNGAVDNANQVNVDTGCIWFGSAVIHELFKLISTDGNVDESKFRAFVNPHVCLNFYADFVYPLAQDSTWEEFAQEAPENGYSPELEGCRREIWKALHSYRLSLVKLIPAQYIHFGMTHEMYDFFVREMDTYSYLGWKKRLNTNSVTGCVLNSHVSETDVPESAYIEDCRIKRCRLGEGVMLSNIDVHDTAIPAEVVMHGLELKNGEYVCRIYGREDNPKSSKDAPFLGSTISKLARLTGISNEAIWGNNPASIWNARIYPICKTMQDAVESAIELHAILQGNASDEVIGRWSGARKTSLAESFLEANVEAILERQETIRNEVQMARFVADIYAGASQNDCLETLIQTCHDDAWCLEMMTDQAGNAEFPYNMRLYLAASEFCRRHPGLGASEQLEDAAYACIKACITRETFARFGIRSFRDVHIVRDEVDVDLPVRVNFCGSPSDAAPYCLEHGGTMIDGTLLL
ncbi:MAG: bifunctional fucokinase/L-fucose-1-P-guanylyltransferase, partial [Proteobacteria bacterium]|nr:bifunctional fucokinase/L-fucose-1-P-guanylyltransferase [Pseudomonadota bacterium]